jgi:O-antigen ligase
MYNYSLSENPTKWPQYLGIIILIEAAVFGLLAYNYIILLVLAGAFGLSVLYFYSLVQKPILWIILIIIGSYLDHWGQIGGGITVFHLAWINSLLAGVIYYLFNHDYKLNFKLPFAVYFYLYIGFAAFSLIYSPNFESGLSYIATSIALFFFAIWIINFLKNKEEFNWIIITLLICSSLLTFLIIYQILTFDPWKIVDVALSETGEKILRPSGTFVDPNVAAAHIVVAVLYGLSFLLYSKPKITFKLFLLLSVVISLVGIILTFSRTVWISLLAGMITLLFYQSRKNNLIILSTFIIFILIFTFYTPYGTFIKERISSIFDIMGDVSIRTRISLIISGFNMFIDHPLLGIGYRAFPLYYDYYIDPLAPQLLLYVKESHTLLITLLAEMSIWGVLIVFLWFKRVFQDIFKGISNNNDQLFRALLIGSLANLVTFIVYSFFYGNIFPHFNFLWLIFGIIYSISYTMQKTTISNK